MNSVSGMSDQSIQLWHGDCLELMHRIPDGSVDLAVTSPPYDNLRNYNNGLQWDFEGIAAQLWRVTAVGGVVVWVVADATVKGSETGTSFRQALHFNSLGFNLHDTMIWHKTNPIPHGPKTNRYTPAFEYMFVFSKGKPRQCNYIQEPSKRAGGRTSASASQRREDGSLREDRRDKRQQCFIQPTKTRSNIWTSSVLPTKESTKHPAQMPTCIAKDHITSWSNVGDTVLDPFLGSGTTMVAAVNTRRCGIGIERDAGYFEIAQKRVADAQAAKSLSLFAEA